MNKRRLLKLADLLEADAKNKKGIKFDLTIVAAKASEDGEYRPSKHYFKPNDTPKLDCGTAACAVGLACISGAFEREGLEFEINETWGLEPTYQGETGWGIEKRFFGISENESFFLFQKGAYPKTKRRGAAGERAVAKRIRDLVAGKVVAPENY